MHCKRHFQMFDMYLRVLISSILAETLIWPLQDDIIVFGGHSQDKQPEQVKASWSVATDFLKEKDPNVRLNQHIHMIYSQKIVLGWPNFVLE